MDLYENPGQDSWKQDKKTALNNSRIRTEKIEAETEHTESNQRVKTCIRADKQNIWKGLQR